MKVYGKYNTWVKGDESEGSLRPSLPQIPDRFDRKALQIVPLLDYSLRHRPLERISIELMKRETIMAAKKDEKKKRVVHIIRLLENAYPGARTALRFITPLELLVATVLSAQCTDERVNRVTEALFKKYRAAKDYAGVDLRELEEDVRPTGFYRNKAKAVKGICQELVARFKGEVPANLDDLVSLPGIGRKTANLVLGEAFGIPGIVVDTHVLRLANRIGLTQNTDAVKVEFDLMDIVPKDRWTLFSNLLILHGRAICSAKKPAHEKCKILDLCDEGMSWKKGA
jgi:endonuclease-3